MASGIDTRPPSSSLCRYRMLSGAGVAPECEVRSGSAFTTAAPAGIEAMPPDAALSTLMVSLKLNGTYWPVAGSNVEQLKERVCSPASSGMRMQLTETPDGVSFVSGGYARKCSGSIFGMFSISVWSSPVKLIFRLSGSPMRYGPGESEASGAHLPMRPTNGEPAGAAGSGLIVISGEAPRMVCRVEVNAEKKSRSSSRTAAVSATSRSLPGASARNFVSKSYTVYGTFPRRWLWLVTDSKFGASGLILRKSWKRIDILRSTGLMSG